MADIGRPGLSPSARQELDLTRRFQLVIATACRNASDGVR